MPITIGAAPLYSGVVSLRSNYYKYQIMILLKLAILALAVGGGLILAAKNLSSEE